MLTSVSFKIAWNGNERFSHFIHDSGIIAVVEKDAEFAKVCVAANNIDEVTEEQREAVMKLAWFPTRENHMVSIIYGAGLSPFLGGAILVPIRTTTFRMEPSSASRLTELGRLPEAVSGLSAISQTSKERPSHE